MKLLIHGNDLEKSRSLYYTKKSLIQNTVFLNGEGITFDVFFQVCENKSLFNNDQTIVIENLFSKNKITTNEIKKILEYIKSNKQLNLLIWEQSELGKTAISQLNNFEIELFSIPQKMFIFLDQIKPNNTSSLIRLFNEVKQTQEPEMILFMLIRQFRLLLQCNGNFDKQIDEVKRMAPWQLSKLKSQAKYFPSQNLLKAYNELFEIERKQKTGVVSFPLNISIDFFLTGL